MILVLFRLHTSLLDVCQEISVGIAIGRCILSDHISLGVDPVARGPGCTRDIKGNVVPVSEDKPMLISGLIIVKPNHLTLADATEVSNTYATTATSCNSLAILC